MWPFVATWDTKLVGFLETQFDGGASCKLAVRVLTAMAWSQPDQEGVSRYPETAVGLENATTKDISPTFASLRNVSHGR